MNLTNPELYQELHDEFFKELRGCLARRFVSDDANAPARPNHEIVEQTVADIMALGFNKTRAAAAADLIEELESNPMIESFNEDDVMERIEFTADNFPDEITIFRQFISAVNLGQKQQALEPVQVRAAMLRMRKLRQG